MRELVKRLLEANSEMLSNAAQDRQRSWQESALFLLLAAPFKRL